jgi:type III secretion protein C
MTHVKTIWALVLLLGLGACALASAPCAARAAEIPWRSPVYTHVADDAPLAAVLRDFAANQGLVAVVSPKVQGTVNGRFVDMAPTAFLDQLCTAYGLTWYFDGSALYVYAADELSTRILSLKFITPSHLRTVLDRLGIYDVRFGWRALDDMGVVYLSGPARYVDLVAETAALVDMQAEQKGDFDVVRIFPLKYAWADDVTFDFMDKSIEVPGVVTVLRNLLAGKPMPGVIDGKQQKVLSPTVEKLKGKGLEARKKLAAEGGSGVEKAEESGAQSAGAASIMADGRLNAVIVRDVRQKMPYYEDLIRAVDVPVGLVQIDAVIMDVSTDYLRTLGIQWRGLGGNPNSAVKTYAGFGATEDFTTGAADLAVGEGLALSTVLEHNGEYFMAKINALQEDGEARVVTRSSVLTINNMEAQLERTETFYVRVQGDQEVDLYDVSSGIVLRVQPHIIYDAPGTKIKLTVTIEDGQPLDTTVDDVPRVQKSTINTQAVVKESQSLLIGGFWIDSKTDAVQKVPLLGDIPILGHLFRTTRKVDTKMERMFLISPRIVTLDEEGEGAPVATTIDPEQDPARIGLRGGVPAMGTSAPPLPAPPNIYRPDRAGPPREQGAATPPISDAAGAGAAAQGAEVALGAQAASGTSGASGISGASGAVAASGAAAPERAGGFAPFDAAGTLQDGPAAGAAAGPDADGLRWLVQVAAYAVPAEAREAVRALERQGYAPRIEPVYQDGRSIQVVHLGSFATRAEARAVADRFYAAHGRRPFVRMQRVPGAVPVSVPASGAPVGSVPFGGATGAEASAPPAAQNGAGPALTAEPVPAPADTASDAAPGYAVASEPEPASGDAQDDGFHLVPPSERGLNEGELRAAGPAVEAASPPAFSGPLRASAGAAAAVPQPAPAERGMPEAPAATSAGGSANGATPSPAAPTAAPAAAQNEPEAGPVYVVQAGSFRALDQAAALAGRVRAAGFEASVFKLFGDDGAAWFVVRAGTATADRAWARAQAETVGRALGHAPLLRRMDAEVLASRTVAY